MNEPKLSIPDFDDMVKIADRIREQNLARNDLDLEIKQRESEIYRITSGDSKYFDKNGKPPSATFVKAAYEYTGLSDELVPLRKSYGAIEAELEYLYKMFDIMKMQVDLYRTESANRRQTSL